MTDKISIGQAEYGDQYEPTDSEEDYSEEEREILKEVRKGRQRFQKNGNEVMRFADSSDEDNDVDELMRDSDIEGADGAADDANIPDAKDWGSKSRHYYHTDFVDQDYSTYNEQEEEMAKHEEEEAKAIQLRLAKQMKEEDFLLDDFKTPVMENLDLKVDHAKSASMLADSTRIKMDFSSLTKRQKQELFAKDSPEFKGLVSDFEEYMKELESLITPVMKYITTRKVPMIPAFVFTELYRNIALTYCSNITFYLLLKAKRIPIKHHPVTKRLMQLKKLLGQLKDKYENIIRPQLEALLERIVDGDVFEVLDVQSIVKKSTKKLDVFKQYEASHSESSNSEWESVNEELPVDGELEEAMEENQDEDERRGINYQIAKNKGLMPQRKKEQRNPRVKHRNKFRKALIRRKGAVRTVRKETKRYGGEISGIKATVNKSIKFKT